MIVTADPVGDFNATSQILRYSALAREVTVPRIPSVASIVFQNGIPTCSSSTKGSGRNSPDAQHLVELEGEISRLGDQLEILTVRLAEERARRKEAEQGWKRAEELAQSLEAEVREECFNEMESRIEIERRRWMNALGEEVSCTEHDDTSIEKWALGANDCSRRPIALVLILTASSNFYRVAFRVSTNSFLAVNLLQIPHCSRNDSCLFKQSTKTLPQPAPRRSCRLWSPKTPRFEPRSTSCRASSKHARRPNLPALCSDST